MSKSVTPEPDSLASLRVRLSADLIGRMKRDAEQRGATVSADVAAACEWWLRMCQAGAETVQPNPQPSGMYWCMTCGQYLTLDIAHWCSSPTLSVWYCGRCGQYVPSLTSLIEVLPGNGSSLASCSSSATAISSAVIPSSCVVTPQAGAEPQGIIPQPPPFRVSSVRKRQDSAVDRRPPPLLRALLSLCLAVFSAVHIMQRQPAL